MRPPFLGLDILIARMYEFTNSRLDYELFEFFLSILFIEFLKLHIFNNNAVAFHSEREVTIYLPQSLTFPRVIWPDEDRD